MRAMVLTRIGHQLEEQEVEIEAPGLGQVQVQVEACGVCRTDLHVVDGELPEPELPIIPGHQVVGRIVKLGSGLDGRLYVGQRVGIPWLGSTCNDCPYCRAGQENLCDQAGFTGYTLPGGYAEFINAQASYCFSVDEREPAAQIAPLLCAGLIGYRALRMTEKARTIGFYGFGSAAHILCQVACHQGREIFAFTRDGDEEGQAFARRVGASWAGGSSDSPPKELAAAIIFAPVGELVTRALKAIRKGGSVVCAGIHMSDIPSFPYSDLWGERVIRSVANLTRRDGEELLRLAPEVPVRVNVTTYPLVEANQALADLREGNAEGSLVLTVETPA